MVPTSFPNQRVPSVVRIAEIEAGSIADELHLEIGTRIVRINGQRVRDGIDLTFLLAESALELETVNPGGDSVLYEIEREPGEPVGIIPAPDAIRECGNKCVFCFIDGNPKDVRDTLWLRDDDFRLSFTYGSYVTLTNVGTRGMERLVEQRISPLYVSVHATEPEVRERLLVNDRAGLIMDQLEYLLGNGLEVHTQVVLCPEWNDREHLDRTIADLYELGEGVLSLSVVPVGLSKYNLGRPVSLLTPDQALKAISQVDRIRERALQERGRGWCYAADEMYLIAGGGFPEDRYYDEGSLTENGVGAINRFVRDFESGLPNAPTIPGRTLRIVTGLSMEGLFRERAARLSEATGSTVEVIGVVNDFYGESVTVAGLLGGQDIVRAVGDTRQGELVLLPAEALNADDLFIDSVPLSEVRETLAPAEVVTGYDLLECLGTLRMTAHE
jgi:putative radical SAM enzyme (TIGR03279 family)